MSDLAFGGNWTDDKLARLAKYLTAYRTIFTRNERARHFTTWYVDAFAGTGSRSSGGASPPKQAGLMDEAYRDAETSGYRAGSARIALGLDHPFDKYLFIEKSKSRVAELRSAIERDYSQQISRCDFKHGVRPIVWDN